MAKQQHQNPKQGTSSKREDAKPAGNAQVNDDRAHSKAEGSPDDRAMDTSHRAGHVSSTDSMYGTHASLGAADERGAGAAHPKAGEGKQPTRGGAQSGLTGSIDQLEPGKSNPRGSDRPRADDDNDNTAARTRPGEAHGESKYSPTADEQDALSRKQGGEPLREPSSGDAQDRQSTGRGAAPGRNPREGGHGAAGDDSPSVRSPADRGSKLTATHDIDLAGPDRSGTKRDR